MKGCPGGHRFQADVFVKDVQELLRRSTFDLIEEQAACKRIFQKHRVLLHATLQQGRAASTNLSPDVRSPPRLLVQIKCYRMPLTTLGDAAAQWSCLSVMYLRMPGSFCNAASRPTSITQDSGIHAFTRTLSFPSARLSSALFALVASRCCFVEDVTTATLFPCDFVA